MIKFSKQVDYALQLLVALHRQKDGEPLSLKQFSTESSISFLFLQKIAKKLRESGLIMSVKGKHGGYRLASSLNIDLKQIVELLDGPFGITRCIRGEECAKDGHCAVQKGMNKLNKGIGDYLESTTVADLISNV